MDDIGTRIMHPAAALALVGAVLLVEPASASPNYAPRLKTALELGSEPGCTICHEDDDGGDGTVDTPFGRSAIDHGARGNNDTGSLDDALLAMYGGQVDSDGDGIPDIVELQQGQDPNIPQALPDPVEPPGTGGEGGATQPTSPGADTAGQSVGSPSSATTGVDRPDPQPLPPELRTGCSVSGPAPWGSLIVWAFGVAAFASNRRGRARRI